MCARSPKDPQHVDMITRMSMINEDGSEDAEAPELRWAESQSRAMNKRGIDGIPVLGHGDGTRQDQQREKRFQKYWSDKEEARFQNDMIIRGYDYEQDSPDVDFWDSIL